MHIVDGALANEVALAGAAMTAAGVAVGLRALTPERIPAAGVLSAAFFVSSLIHVPLGPVSAHLTLSGLAGLVLGWAAFPALFVGLTLQTAFLGFGGVTALGVNTLAMAGPAVAVWALCGRGAARGGPQAAALWGATAGALAIALGAVVVAGALALGGPAFRPAAALALAAHVPLMAVEAALTAAAVGLLRRVRPEALGAAAALFLPARARR
jgi:cobalt/nickel transport system permease protein